MTSRNRTNPRRHPGDGAWRAYLDGELPALRRLELLLHTRRCADCRERLEWVRTAGARTSRLLDELPDSPNVADGWARIMVLAGGGRSSWSALSAFLAGGLSVATVAASVLLLSPTPTRLLGRVHGASAFVGVLDRCCSDDSVAGASKAGALTLEMPGVVPSVTVRYMDVDGSGDLSTGDIVRSVTRVRRRPRRARRPLPAGA